MYDLKNTKMIIYKITNIANGKCYIGQTTRTFEQRYDTKGEGIERVYNYHKNLKDKCRHYNEHFLRAIEKYGFDSFTVEILEVCKTKNKLDDREKFYIRKYKSSNPNYGYNKTRGGDGVVHTREIKTKSIATRKNNTLNKTTALYEKVKSEIIEIKINTHILNKISLGERRVLLVLLSYHKAGLCEIDVKELKYLASIVYTQKRFVKLLEKIGSKSIIDLHIEGDLIKFKIVENLQSGKDYDITIKTMYAVEMKTYIEVRANFLNKNIHIKKCLNCEKEVAYSTRNNQKYCEKCVKEVRAKQRKESRKEQKSTT